MSDKQVTVIDWNINLKVQYETHCRIEYKMKDHSASNSIMEDFIPAF